MLARGAADQARLAWPTKNAFEQANAGTVVDEQGKEDAIGRGEAPQHRGRGRAQEARALASPRQTLVEGAEPEGVLHPSPGRVALQGATEVATNFETDARVSY